ncbi:MULTISPECIES: hypothetical protein [Salinivibrio]|uniref:hypothetical protein n=1 Tax=Salinivibrio TaxID=51366 RepID=UPI000985B143|nr:MULTISPECIES: hypothetical protein [Salinivibrio]OOF09074.1 hypothetical protein BZG82_12180 [Salinivibrio sp. PR5]OOF12636.1 hypothetical protein BZG83_11235 [Salinivibrio sp. PR919]OOF14279.1 hypothetical protein BZG84_14445 [Salinivibrio sp. PR932]OOF32054.1 hypothetical protein BZJ20_02635 [Salinivibrio proteolyticus]
MEVLSTQLKTPTEVVFDYTHFLCEEQQPNWTFVDIFRSLLPAFNTVLEHHAQQALTAQDRLHQQAAQVLSFRNTDTVNLVRLAKLAQQQNIRELTILMPYALEYRQMEAISDQTGALLEYSNENREWVRLTFPAV